MNVTSALRAPLTPTQRDIYLDQQLHLELPIYRIGCSVDLGPGIDRARWEEAVRLVFSAEPIMRSRLDTSEAVFFQYVDDDATIRLAFDGDVPVEAEARHAWIERRLRSSPAEDAPVQHLLVRTTEGEFHSALGAPHVFSDGHSYRVFFERVSRCYEALVAGRRPPMLDGSPSFYDYVTEARDEPGDTAMLAAWQERLRSVEPLQFRTRREVPGEYASDQVTLSAAETDALSAFCRAHGFGPATLFLGLHALVVERYREPTGDWATHVIRGRRPPAYRDTMGCFFSVLPYLMPVKGLRREARLAGLFAYLRNYTRELGSGRDISMLDLRGCLPAAGCRAVYNFYDFDRVDVLGRLRNLEIYFSHPPTEAHLIVASHGSTIELRHFFHTSELNGGSVVERIRRLAAQVAAGAERVSDLDDLLDDERPALPHVSSDGLGQQAAETLPELFEKQVATQPESVALVAGRHWTYSELNGYANRLARVLVDEGVRPGVTVALHLDRSVHQVAAVLAVLKAGGAYVPIDPEYPASRARFILDDSHARLMLADRVVPGSPQARTLMVDDLAPRVDAAQSSNLGRRATVDDLAYLIYTSGSTGLPKGVLIAHRNVTRLFGATRALFGFGAADVWPLLHSYAFDFSVWEIWGALAFGGRLVVVPSALARSPEALCDLFEREGVTVLNQTPTAFYHLMDAERARGSARLGRLRLIVFGGEAIDVARLRPWFERYSESQPALVNMYGITETTVHATWRRLRREDCDVGRPSVIGRPLPDLHVLVVDGEGQPVPRGVAGELWVGGAGVGLGYLDRPDLTATRFVPDPLDPGGTTRMYRSGDLVRELEGGDLEYIGRIDEQVQIRGYRVEPGEIEAALRERSGVLDAAVLPQAGVDGERMLIAYVVREHESGVGETELREHLSCRLPAYMACSRFCFLPRLPLTTHGKVDRSALPAPGNDRPKLSQSYVPPRTQVEELLATVFAAITGREQIGVRDDFFALGGNSLSATQVVARVRQLLGVEVPISAMFERPTVAALADAIAGRRFEDASAPPQVVRVEAGGHSPLTFAQERVWLIQELNPDSVAYNFEASFHFRGELETGLLERCLQELVERHEVLRTTFPVVDGRPVQRLHPSAPVVLDTVSLEHLPAHEALRQAEIRRREASSRPFVVDRLPLVRWTLYRLSPKEHVLVHREHHLLHDGWSFLVLWGELLSLYRAHLDGQPPALPPLPLRLSDFARAEREWVRGPQAKMQLAYWRRQLARARPSLELPADLGRPAHPTYRGDALHFELPEDLVGSLRALARENGVTLFATMLGAFAVLLARYSGEKDLCIGSGFANRHRPELEAIVGMMLNNVVLRVDLGGEPSLASVVKQVQRVVLEAFSNQALPFDRVVRLLRPDGDPAGGLPVCPVFFSSYEGPMPQVPIPGLTVDVEGGLPNGSAKFDLNVIVVVRPEGGLGLSSPVNGASSAERVTVIWEYSTDLFRRDSMEQMIRNYLHLLGAAVADPQRPWDELELASERDSLTLARKRAGSSAYPRDASIVDLWQEQVARSPDTIAVRDVDGAWTYRQVEVVANQLAHLLLRRGVQSEELVGILLPRGWAVVACMLGILKAGAAYLPLDPRDPASRVAWLAAETGIRFVLTYASSRALLQRCARLEPLCLDELGDELAAYGEAPPPYAAGAESLAYVMFTSGSTGPPKGVEILHRGVVRLLFGIVYARLGPDTRILQVAPFSFDASTFEIWAALLHGGTLSIYPDDLPDAPSLGRAIAEDDINTMWLNASLFNTIVDQEPTVLAPLEQLLIGGEALSVEHVRRAYAHLPWTQIVNGYGPTENTTFSCCYPIPRDLPAEAHSVPLGRPIAHSSAYVLDERMRPLPAGLVGDIYLGGDGVARGYRSRPDLTAHHFLPDPFDSAPGARLYRSGDLGRFLPDGTLEFHGRRDGQLKIRGYRIEPAEVEWALERLGGVRQCAVVGRADGSGSTRLVAYVVPEDEDAADADRLRAKTREELPAHLVPQDFVLLDALPLSPNGKLDRAALPAPPARRGDRAGLPRNAREEIVAGVMADVLGLEEVDVGAHFFDLGGHSLMGLELLERLSRVFAVEIPVRALMENPTAMGLAALVEAKWNRTWNGAPEHNGPPRSLVPIKPGGSKPPLFFTPGGDGGEGALLVYARVARFVGPEQPFYGLRARAADDGAEPHRSVEEMAADYLAEVKQVQPRGPYFFAGECVGGVVAYEMARQAVAAGDEVGLLTLLDTRPPQPAGYLRHWLRYLSALARRWADGTLGSVASPATTDGPSPGRVERAKKWLRGRLEDCLPYDAREAPPTIGRRWVDYQRTLLRYRLLPYPRQMVLLLSEHYAASNIARAWERWVRGGVEVQRAPGDHDSYIREHARQTAGILAASLDRARNGA
jgi:amino acid adenylation domain-containing protein